MRKILTIMWKDVNVLLQDRAALLLVIAGPLVLTLGLGLITGSFGGDDTPAIGRVSVLLIDQDGGPSAQALIDVFQSDDLSQLLAPEQWNDEAAALEQVRTGEAAAAVIIPAGFSAGLSVDPRGEPAAPVALRVFGDAGAPIGASVVRGITDAFVTRAQTGATAVGIALTELATTGALPPAELPAAGQAMGEQLFSADGAAPPITVRVESATGGGEGFNPLYIFAPGMALLFLMYAVTLGARTLLSERREGTLARMLAAPVTPRQVLSGKVAGIFLGGFIQLGVLILLTSLLFQLRWGDPLGVLLLVVAAALAATGWGLLVASAATNAGQVMTIGTALMLIFGILGGSFVPLQDASPLIDALSRITPNRWALDGFIALAIGDGLSAVLVPVAALLLMAAVLFVVSAALLRRRQTSLLTG